MSKEIDYDLRSEYFRVLEEENKQLLDADTGMLDTKISNIINCPLCDEGPEKNETLFIKNGYTFVRCPVCGMIFTNPQVDHNLVEKLYHHSKSNDLWVKVLSIDRKSSWKKQYYREHIDLLKGFIKKPDVKAIDIGTSIGQFIEMANELEPDWEVMGLDLNKEAVKTATERGLRVERVLFNDFEEKDKFDIYTLFGVLEHLADPGKILKEIKACASDDSKYLMIVVPNAYSLYHMLLQSQSVTFDGRTHLMYFSETTLKRLLEEAGFEVVHLDTCLTGLDNMVRQMQWYPPYSRENTHEYLPGKLREKIENGDVEKFLHEMNLGLRLRVIARF